MEKKSTYHFNASDRTKTYARFLRRNQTPAEERLWEIVRNRNINGLKFRRQHPLSNFIADFYCHELLLVIELDGEIHNKKNVKLRDEIREEAIVALGLKVIRFKNEDALYNPGFIIDKIIELKEEKEIRERGNPHLSAS